jgi:hypothetical protein
MYDVYDGKSSTFKHIGVYILEMVNLYKDLFCIDVYLHYTNIAWSIQQCLVQKTNHLETCVLPIILRSTIYYRLEPDQTKKWAKQNTKNSQEDERGLLLDPMEYEIDKNETKWGLK